MYICSVYKEFPRYNLSIEIKDHKFWRFKTLMYNHHSSKPGHIPDINIASTDSVVYIIGVIIYFALPVQSKIRPLIKLSSQGSPLCGRVWQ